MAGDIPPLNVPLFRQLFPYFKDPEQFSDPFLESCYDASLWHLEWQRGTRPMMLMTAHIAYLSVNAGAGKANGMVQASTVGKVQVQLVAPPVKSQWQWWLGLTPYGQELLAILASMAVGGFLFGGRPEGRAFRKVGGVWKP